MRARVAEWLRQRDLELIGSFLVLVLLILGFVQLGALVSGDSRAWDEAILRAMRDPRDASVGLGPAATEGMMRDITALGSGTLSGAFSIALVGWLLLTGRPGAALVVALAVFGGWGLNELLKELYARERPTVVPHLMGATNESFPSGHTMISAVIYPTMAEVFGRMVRQRRVRFYLMGLAIFIAFIVGVSRVYMGVHYPSDVLGGLCMGFAWALVCGIVVRMFQRSGMIRTRAKEETSPTTA
jgi:undecaprenyl-diphosphatase